MRSRINKTLEHLSCKATRYTGSSWAFAIAAGSIVVWLATGPLFGFSDTWQLAINTGTTIVTFLMVFLIQNTQNRDTAAMQLKLDELIRTAEGAHNALLDVEKLTEHDLRRIIAGYEALADAAREQLRCGMPDTGSPEVGTEDRRAAVARRRKTG